MIDLGADQITVLRSPPGDAFGDPTGAAAETLITGCSIQPGSSSEDVNGRDQVITDLSAFLPAGTDITSTDRVRWQGVDYAVHGQPQRWADLEGVESHVHVTLRRVTG